MLVPSMTFAEIKKEIYKDFIIVNRKVNYLEQELWRSSRPHGNEKVVKYHDYNSKYKNKWLFRIEATKKSTYATAMVYYYNNIGLVGLVPVPEDDLLVYHTAHFFKRFNERQCLNLGTPYEIMRAFINECDEYNLKKLHQFEPGIYKIFCATEYGYLLGTYLQDLGFLKINTYITFAMLKGDQIPLAERLTRELDKYQSNASNLFG